MIKPLAFTCVTKGRAESLLKSGTRNTEQVTQPSAFKGRISLGHVHPEAAPNQSLCPTAAPLQPRHPETFDSGDDLLTSLPGLVTALKQPAQAQINRGTCTRQLYSSGSIVWLPATGIKFRGQKGVPSRSPNPFTELLPPLGSGSGYLAYVCNMLTA